MKPLRAYSIMAHGICCVLPQALTSVPLFPTILLFAMRGSQLLTVSLDAVLLRKILFAWVVEPQLSNGDCVMESPLKKTSFPLPSVAKLPSKKQNVMNFIPFIQEKVAVQHSAAPSLEVEVDVNLLFMNWQSLTKN
ncbi:uncharacterized protein MONOS_17985 [Monocercomonoides exilis]|uniref:uncharacterized protein n=1 Tax=Monocercomonoides exilis TaxID=2049356 RepID=UPI00355A1CE8|nr:hypothetical protein MONOS_17985 [Monocercomonoides exilis]